MPVVVISGGPPRQAYKTRPYLHTEGDLEAALERAAAHTGPGPLVIEVHLDSWDVSEAFAKMSEGLRSR